MFWRMTPDERRRLTVHEYVARCDLMRDYYRDQERQQAGN